MKTQSSLCYMYSLNWRLLNWARLCIYIPLHDILVSLNMLSMTLSQWCYIIPDPVVVGAGPVTEGEWAEGDEGDAPPDGA